MLTKRFLSLILALSLLMATTPIAPAQAACLAAPAATTWYVNHAAVGSNTGSSWTDAFTCLQSALEQVQPGDRIWVATGVYTPTNTSDRTATFNLKAGVAIYGGFAPASGADTWGERDWQTHITVLSSDLDGNDITDPNGVVTSTTNIVGNNAYHVISSTGLTQTARLDGFYVTAGKANGGYPKNNDGGGMYNDNSSPSLVNVVFSANQSNHFGGGIYNKNGNPSLVNGVFIANRTGDGGGIYNENSSPSLVNVAFIANQATYNGGGMDGYQNTLRLVNVAFYGNRAINYGGGAIKNEKGSLTLVNAIFSGNQAGYGGGIHNSWESDLNLVNVTIAANQANTGGGINVNDTSGITISNSIVWGNSGAQVYNEGSSAVTLRSSLVQGGCPAGSTCENLIDADPLFMRSPSPGPDTTWGTSDDDYGDLRLQFTSPAIDAGNNTYLPADLLDLDGDGDTAERIPLDMEGMPRFADIYWITDSGVSDPPDYPFIVDMGAYEAFTWFLYLPVVSQ